jgi:predicted nucleotidyltransferase
MISRELMPYIQEFVEEARKIRRVISVSLFGSVARGEATRESDMDLLVLVDEEKVEGSETLKKLLEVERRVEEKGARLELTVMNPAEFRSADKNFIENVFREGVLLIGAPLRLACEDLDLHPYVVFIYSLRGMENPDKLRLLRAVYGKKTVKKVGGKEYVSETQGVITEGAKLGRNIVMFPEEKAGDMRGVLRGFGVEYVELKVFAPREEFEKLRRLS